MEQRILSGEHVTRLVDAKISQLRDAVGGARVPFLIAVSWTFIWAATIYNHDHGYTRDLIHRYETALADNAGCPCRNEKTIVRYHPALFAADTIAHRNNDRLRMSALHEQCKRALAVQLEELYRKEVRDWEFTVPGLGVHAMVFDLGILGNTGLLLIMTWFYYASRRENHAVQDFVTPRQSGSALPYFGHFILQPANARIPGPHYAYAHQAVAQRFVFLTSRRNWTLLGVTSLMFALPALVSVFNLYTDVRDIKAYQLWVLVGDREIATVGLSVVLAFVTAMAIRLQWQTSSLLNGWYLASRDVWEGADPSEPCPLVDIDAGSQVARIYKGQRLGERE